MNREFVEGSGTLAELGPGNLSMSITNDDPAGIVDHVTGGSR